MRKSAGIIRVPVEENTTGQFTWRHRVFSFDEHKFSGCFKILIVKKKKKKDPGH